MAFEKIFEEDILSKRERTERALNFQPVDRVPIHEQLSYNSGVLSLVLGRQICGFEYGRVEIGEAIRKTLDVTFPFFPPVGEGTETDKDGFTYKCDNWTKWRVSRPFEDAVGARDWLLRKTKENIKAIKSFNASREREKYLDYFVGMQSMIGETILMDVLEISTGFCDVFDKMGLEIFSYFYYDYPEIMKDYMESSGELAVKKVQAVGDNSLTPVTCIAEDFCTKQGPIFSPELLDSVHYPYVKSLTEAWHEKGLKVIYHTDGNFKKVIPELLGCGVDGFYCLERACGMHIEELSKQWPAVFWAGGVDGTNIMERGTTEQTKEEVRKIITETNALTRGGIFIDTASEINPPIKPENFIAMLEATDELRNPDY